MTSKSTFQGKSTRMPSLEGASSGLKQCMLAQDQLEDAISGVMKAEQQLRENAREVRWELQSCVSRQQEALRCREVWLLGQIELLEQVKTETLQQQLQRLHWLRGQFDIISHQLQKSNSSCDLNEQLSGCMEKLSSLSLTPEETPEMSFRADTRSLKEAITSFGSVTAQLEEGVASPVLSCPTKKQKMGVDHLSDWLLGARPTSLTPIGYQSSKNPQDWLMSHKESKTSCPDLASMGFMKAWGQLRDLETWLLKDQTSISRQRSVSSCSSSSSSFSIEKIDDSDLIDALQEEELSDWLVTPPTIAMKMTSDAERWKQVLKPFEDSWSCSNWLVGTSRPTAECSTCCKTSKALEIENLGQLSCLKTPPTSSPASTTAPRMALEEWLQQELPVQQACRANQLCANYSECVFDENCGKDSLNLWLLQQDGRDKNGVPIDKNGVPTIKKDPPTTDNAQPTTKNAPRSMHHREQEQKVQAILEAWLHPTNISSCRSPPPPLASSLSGWVAPEVEKVSGEEDSSQFKSSSSCSSLFQLPLDPELWVIPRKSSRPAQISAAQPSPPAEEDKWLLKKRSQECLALPTVCDLFSCMKLGGDKEKWLHQAPVQM